MSGNEKNTLPETMFKVVRVVHTTPEALEHLCTTLDDFEEMDPALVALKETSGAVGYGIAVAGDYAVLVNAEGYGYPRYRGPQIRVELLAKLLPHQARKLCVRKSFWRPGFRIDDAETLDKVACSPYAYAD